MSPAPSILLAASEPTPVELALARYSAAEREVNTAGAAVLQAVANLSSARVRLAAAQVAVMTVGAVASPGSLLSQ